MATDWALQMALANSGMYGPNKYQDPQFQNKPFPPPTYRGTPTDAMGRPIAAQPGTTLNTSPVSAPVAAPAAGGGLTPWQQYQQNVAMHPGGGAGRPQGIAASDLTSILQHGGTPSGEQWAQGLGQMNAQNAQNAQGQGGQGVDPNSYQNALDLLSNPGPVTTPGATVPEAQPLGSQTPSVLQSFLASKSGGQGAGNYNNQGFFNTLNALQGGSGAAGGSPTGGGSNTMGGMSGPFAVPPQGGTNAPLDFMTQGYLSASGAPLASLGAAMSPFAAAQRRVGGG